MSLTYERSGLAGPGWPGLALHQLLGRVDLRLPDEQEEMGKQKTVESWGAAPPPESAWLGPQIWDRRLTMKTLELEAEWVAGGAGGFTVESSPPGPQQQFPATSAAAPAPTFQHQFAVGAADQEGRGRAWPGSPALTPYTEQKADLALATVPGMDFDPKKRVFSAEELKPQPIIKKRRKVSLYANAIQLSHQQNSIYLFRYSQYSVL